jgi:hypothetical protein
MNKIGYENDDQDDFNVNLRNIQLMLVMKKISAKRTPTINLCLLGFWSDQVVCNIAKGKIDIYILFPWF